MGDVTRGRAEMQKRRHSEIFDFFTRCLFFRSNRFVITFLSCDVGEAEEASENKNNMTCDRNIPNLPIHLMYVVLSACSCCVPAFCYSNP